MSALIKFTLTPFSKVWVSDCKLHVQKKNQIKEKQIAKACLITENSRFTVFNLNTGTIYEGPREDQPDMRMTIGKVLNL